MMNLILSMTDASPDFMTMIASDISRLVMSFLIEERASLGPPSSHTVEMAQQFLFKYDQTDDIIISVMKLPHTKATEWSPHDWLNWFKALYTAKWTMLDYEHLRWNILTFNNPELSYANIITEYIEPVVKEKEDILKTMEFFFPEEKFGWPWEWQEFGAPIFTDFEMPLKDE